MAKRFTSTEIWSEDWFLDMPNEYRLFWFYMLSNCDHSGVFKVNVRSFSGLVGVSVSSKTALSYFNTDKQRIREISQSVWYVEEFFVFQYGTTFNNNNPLHESIEKIYNKYGIEKSSVRGLKDLKERTKDKDKVISSLEENKILQQNENYFKMLIPEMMKVWKKHRPQYPIDKEKDYPSLLQLAYKIAEHKGWKRAEILDVKEANVLKSWEDIAEFASKDSWYSNKPLSVIINQWQGIFQKMIETKNPENGAVVKKMVM